MKKLRTAAVPLLTAAVLTALALVSLSVPVIVRFDFLWDVLLGAALGAAFYWLPALSGFPVKKNLPGKKYWICAFVMLVMMCCQYFSLASGLDFRFLSVLANPSVRVRVVEGAFFAFCAFHALRGKN